MKSRDRGRAATGKLKIRSAMTSLVVIKLTVRSFNPRDKLGHSAYPIDQSRQLPPFLSLLSRGDASSLNLYTQTQIRLILSNNSWISAIIIILFDL